MIIRELNNRPPVDMLLIVIKDGRFTNHLQKNLEILKHCIPTINENNTLIIINVFPSIY